MCFINPQGDLLVGHNKNVSIVHANEFQPLPKRPVKEPAQEQLEEELKERKPGEDEEERVKLPRPNDKKPLEHVRVSDRNFLKMKKRADDISRQVEQAVRLSQSPAFRKKRRVAGTVEASFEESEGEGGAPQGHRQGGQKKGQEQGSHHLLH